MKNNVTDVPGSPNKGTFIPKWVFIVLFLTCSFQGFSQFQNIYGDPNDNIFNKVVRDGSNYYVLGTNNGSATVSRINSAGVLQWTRSLNTASGWTDAALTANGNLFVVGLSGTTTATNRSTMGVITAAGTFSWVRSYDFPGGLEAFTGVARDPSTGSFYVLGFQHESGGAAFQSDVVMLSVSSAGVVAWKKKFLSSGDDDFARDLEVLPNGEFIVAGNINGFGEIFHFDSGGNLINGANPFDPGSYTYTDIAQRNNGGYYAAGNIFPTGTAHLTRFDIDFLPVWDVAIPALGTIDQVLDAGGGVVYVVGTALLSSGQDQGVVLKITDNGSPTLVWTKHYSNGEASYSGGAIALLPSGDIAFVDARAANPHGFGGNDGFLAVGNMSATLSCLDEDFISLEESTPQFNGPVIELLFFDVNPGTDLTSTLLMWAQSEACGAAPCQASFTVNQIGNCGHYQVTNTSTGTPPFTYQWCDGQTTANLDVQLPCGPHTFCVTVICADGSTSSATQTVNVVDNIPPVAKCLPGFGITLGPDCTYAVTAAAINDGSTDNCQIQSLSVNPALLTGCGNFPITLTVTDWCGNTSTCTTGIQTIEIVLPSIVCPQNTTVNTLPGQCYYTGTIPLATATDNCDPNPEIICSLLTPTQSILITPQTQFPKGTNNITCYARDNCNNASQNCNYTLTVRDNQPPTITCPLSITVLGTSSPPPVQCQAVVNGLAPTASDNCPMLGVAYTISAPTGGSGQNDASGTNFMQGASTVTYTATDMGGNTKTCSFTITVNCDMTPVSKFKCGMAVTTYYSISNPLHKVLSVRDIRNCSGIPKGYNWLAPEISDPSWTVANLGEIFGIAVDKSNNIYVCATSLYSQGQTLSYGSGGSGAIYKIDAVTCVPSLFVKTSPFSNTNTIGTNTIPNVNNSSLGNICYDPNHGGPGGQFFVTNLEDGKIYRLNAAGIVQSVFDPFSPDNGTSGMACVGERIFGIGYLASENRIYFSQNNQTVNNAGVGPNKIYSVALNASGDFSGSESLEINPITPYTNSRSNPVTDIEFSADGKMILAEHTENDNTGCASTSSAHSSRALEYLGGHFTGWSASPQTFYIGNSLNNANSAGGVDYGYSCFDPAITQKGKCDSTVWVSGDALVYPSFQPPPLSPPVHLYGIAGIPASGNAPSVGTNYAPLNSIYVDDDSDLAGNDKYRIGDVDIIHCGCPSESSLCDSISVTSTPSPVLTDSCCFILTLHNQKPNYFTGIQLCTNNGVSISAVGALNGWTINGYTSQFLALVPPPVFAGVGNVDFIKFCLSNYKNVPNQQVIVKYFGPDETVVCVDTLIYNCTAKPKCLKLTDTVECAANGQYKMSFCIMSNALIGWNVNSIQLNPPPGVTFTPSIFAVSNMTPGQMQCGFMTLISGAVDGQTICYSVTAHKEDIFNNPNINPTNCCTDTLMLGCVTMPECICNHLSANAVSVQVPGDSCCWKVNLTNTYSNTFFTGVQLDIITPNVVFGAIVNPLGSGWSSVSTSIKAVFKPKPAGNFIGATGMLPTFCLSGIALPTQVPQVIVLTWLGPNGITVCKDTLYFDCPPPVYAPCAALTNWKIDCDPASPGNYIFTFQVTNNSGFNANQIVLNNVAPPFSITPTAFSIPTLLPGQTSGIQTAYIFGVPPNQNVYFNLTLHEVFNGSELNCCTNSQQYCLPVPECPNEVCMCGTFTNLFARPTTGAPSIPLTCGGMPVLFPCPINGQGYVFTGQFQCQGSNCPMTVQVGWTLTQPDGTVTPVQNISANPNFTLNLPANLIQQSGVYMLTFIGHCGTKECPCVIKFLIETPCSGEACECGSFSDMTFRPSQGGFTMPVNCGDSLTVGCVPQFNPIIAGTFMCAGANCVQAPPVQWELRKLPSNTLVASGNLSGPNFSVALLASYFATPGMFELTFNGQCGTQSCPPCKFKINALGCPCTCGMFEQIQLVNKKLGTSQSLTCNNTQNIAMTCPPVGKPYKITGKLVCNPTTCTGTNLHWELKAGGTVLAFGNQTGPWFSITLDNTVLAGLNGLYNLVLTGTCGNNTCTCVLYFDIAGCPSPTLCPCDNTFPDHVVAGFNYTFDFNDGTCKWLFTPNALAECDKVDWTIQGQNITFTASGTTTSSQPLIVTFPSGTIGSYQICMKVTRPGTTCEVIFCQTVKINCLVTPTCSLGVLSNGGFEESATPGILGAGGSSAGWARQAGTPRVVEGPGCLDPYYMTIVGKCRPNPIDIIDHQILVDTIKGFHLRACYKALEEDLRPGTVLVVRLSDEHLDTINCLLGCVEIAQIPITTATGGEWQSVNTSFYLDGVSGNKYLTMHLENDLMYDNPDANSTISIDNICVEQDESTTLPVRDVIDAGTNIRIVPNPNPGTFTVELPHPATPGMIFRITDLTGRVLLVKATDTGSIRQMVQSDILPDGLYFLQVIMEGRTIAVQRFVKQ